MLQRLLLLKQVIVIRVCGIFILKKEEPQIKAKNISKDKSKVLASLITSLYCGYVINA